MEGESVDLRLLQYPSERTRSLLREDLNALSLRHGALLKRYQGIRALRSEIIHELSKKCSREFHNN